MKGSTASRLEVFPRARLERLPASAADDIAWPALDGQLIIACTSRVGSTALCRYIEKTRCASHIVEAFNPKPLKTIVDRRKLDGMDRALAWRMAQSVEQGWFVAKAGIPGLPVAERLGHMARYGDVTSFWFLLRRDIVAQAISLGTAQLSGQFHSSQPSGTALTAKDYDEVLLTGMVRTIVAGNRILDNYLLAAGRGATILFYEDFAEGDFRAIDAMLDEIGLPKRTAPPARPPTDVRPLIRSVSSDWAARLRDAPGVAALIEDNERFVSTLAGRHS